MPSKQMKEDMHKYEERDVKKRGEYIQEAAYNVVENNQEHLSNKERMEEVYKYKDEREEWNKKEWILREINEEKQESQKISNYLRKVSSSPSFESTLLAYKNATKESNRSTKSNPTKNTEGQEDCNRQKVVRKKSGELVKSSLKSEKHKRPQSMPSTPIMHKNVQFATKLEEIKHFSQAEKPEEVSRSGLLDETYQDTYEMAFDSDLYDLRKEKNSNLTIELVNFENSKVLCLSQNVQLETVYLSSDKKRLLGRVAVRNISFEKIVGIRFTMDFWQTISEINAEYTDDILTKQYKDDLDRFVFNIKLHELMNIENKTLYLCVRYKIPGEEFWDNNSGMNYKIGFKREFKTQTRPSTHFPAFSLRNRYLNDDDFNTGLDPRLSIFQLYKNDPFHMSPINDDTNTKQLSRKKDNFSNIFSNRYDFSTSLTAAIKASGTTNYNENKNKDSKTKDPNSYEDSIKNVDLYFSNLLLIDKPLTKSQSNISFGNDISNTLSLNDTKLSVSFQENKAARDLFKGSSKPSVDSVLYQNFLDSYCFFRGSDKLNTQDSEYIAHTDENPRKNIPPISHKKSSSTSSLSSLNEFIPISSLSESSLFYSQSSLSSIPSVDSVSNIQQPSESKSSIDLYYNHIINSSLTLDTPGGTLTAIRT
ncbi:hypothetical protein T552_01669 [Pneumocystis carinii B80]|uniref:CBM21 domain-containing protein n=1 Tax=Pneumocystis carinii (strain B80) TaxID=1408658 RepID=A0A0W4ZJ63_PNEC8|nr:hypothetical protein T552_01669 [Pneumocystis carinii B80]KTW28407.1 hypothetical protein T552_01669 [Pneumocystis carinii B80]